MAKSPKVSPGSGSIIPNVLEGTPENVRGFLLIAEQEAKARLSKSPLTGQDRSLHLYSVAYQNSQDQGAIASVLRAISQSSSDFRTTPSLVALSTTSNKLLTLQEVIDIENKIKNSVSLSFEHYILVSVQDKTLQNNFSQKDISEKARPWIEFSGAASSVYGSAKSPTKTAYSTEVAKIAEGRLITDFVDYDPITTPIVNLEEKFTQAVSAWLEIYGRGAITLSTGKFKIGVQFKQASTDKTALYTRFYQLKFNITVDDQVVVSTLYLKDNPNYALSMNDLTISKDSLNKPPEGPFTNLLLSDSPGSLADKKDIAHWKNAESTLKNLGLRKTVEESLNRVTTSLQDPNISKEQKEILQSMAAYFKDTLKLLNDQLTTARGITGTLAEQFDASTTSQDLKNIFLPTNQQAFKVSPDGKYLQVNVVTKTKTTTNFGSRTINIDSTLVASNIMRSRDSAVYSLMNSLFNRSFAGPKERVVNNAIGDILNTAGSFSPSTMLIGMNLLKIFGDEALPGLKQQLQRNKPKGKATSGKMNVARVAKAKFDPKNKANKIKNIPQGRLTSKIKNIKPKLGPTKPGLIISRNRLGSKLTEKDVKSLDLLSQINSILKHEVIKQMRYPALVNRTGRFASSVVALSEVDGIVEYSYLTTPYAIFEQGSQGRSPWNSNNERDPRSIINNAISAIGSRLGVNLRGLKR